MTRTIQDLKDQNQLLRDGIRTITAALNSGEYGSMTSIDPDLAGLHVSVGHLVTEHGHAVRQRDMAHQAMDAWVERSEQERGLSPGLEWAIARCEALQKQGFTHSRNDVLAKDFRNCISALKSDVAVVKRGDA